MDRWTGAGNFQLLHSWINIYHWRNSDVSTYSLNANSNIQNMPWSSCILLRVDYVWFIYVYDCSEVHWTRYSACTHYDRSNKLASSDELSLSLLLISVFSSWVFFRVWGAAWTHRPSTWHQCPITVWRHRYRKCCKSTQSQQKYCL